MQNLQSLLQLAAQVGALLGSGGTLLRALQTQPQTRIIRTGNR